MNEPKNDYSDGIETAVETAHETWTHNFLWSSHHSEMLDVVQNISLSIFLEIIIGNEQSVSSLMLY